MTTVVVLELVDNTSVQLQETIVDVVVWLISIVSTLETESISLSIVSVTRHAVEYPCYRRLNVDLPLLVLTEVELEVNTCL